LVFGNFLVFCFFRVVFVFLVVGCVGCGVLLFGYSGGIVLVFNWIFFDYWFLCGWVV